MKERSKSTLILLATLLVGVVLGAVLNGWFFRSRLDRIRHFGAPQGFAKMIVHELEPIDSAKREAVQAAAVAAGERMRVIMHRTHCDMLANMQTLDQQLAPLVDAERLARTSAAIHAAWSAWAGRRRAVRCGRAVRRCERGNRPESDPRMKKAGLIARP
jgi:hypothetical protein